ncbi:MAG: hypothetical protein JO110_25790 [Acetobacteraceae bacterium]|nr:hypothetical protein [Acetobacteraceae bacterium]
MLASATGPAEKPVIRVAPGKVDVLATAGEAALRASLLPIFQRGDALVRPLCWEIAASDQRTTIAAGLKKITQPAMIDLLAQAADWVEYDGRAKRDAPCDPPELVAKVILSRCGFWTVPPIAGVITTPTLRRDGSILAEPGYDPATRLFYMPDPGLVMPAVGANPSRADAVYALELLQALLSEFPFVADVDRAVAISGMITAVTRGAFSVAPLHAFRAPTAGTGKSFLVDLASAIATGRICPVAAASPKEEELEKRLVALLLSGFPCISVDNVNGILGGDFLCQAIERPLLRVRPLGRSEIIEIESRATLFATGNALRVAGDMTRRTLVCDLDAKMEHPEDRTFSFDPVQRVLADRGQYVGACLTIVRAYLQAGSPGLLKPLASFGGWSDLVRSSLVWLGCADPVQSVQAARDDDPELGALRQVLILWQACFGERAMTARQVADSVAGFDPNGFGGARLLDLRNALAEGNVAGVRGTVDATRLGYWLRKVKGRIANGIRFTTDGIDRSGVTKWSVVKG